MQPSGIWLLTITSVLVLLLGTLPVIAREVYHWIDADGVVHFSESPPEDPGLPVQILQLDAPVQPVEDRLDAVLEVAGQLESSRLARESARTEAWRATQEAAREQNPAVPPAPAPVYLYPPSYPPFYYPRPWPPQYPPRQDPGFSRHPPPRPPVAPVNDPAVAWGSRR